MAKKALVEIGGIPIQEKMSWGLTAGVKPFVGYFTTKVGFNHSEIAALKNPVDMKMEIDMWTGMPPLQTNSLLFENLYLLEPKQISKFEYRWGIADVRWSWRGKRLVYGYNITRDANQRSIGVTADETDPAATRQYYDLFKNGRYLRWSLRGGELLWNQVEIVEEELAKLGVSLTPAQHDGAYILENQRADGIDIYKGLSLLLSKSRLDLTVLPNGSVKVYSLDFFEQNMDDKLYDLSQHASISYSPLYLEDKSRIRPEKIVVRFEKMEEIRVVASQSSDAADWLSYRPSVPVSPHSPVWTQQDIDNRKVIGCENVLPCPFPVASSRSGGRIDIGEWTPVWEYIGSLDPALSFADLWESPFEDRLVLVYHNRYCAAWGLDPNSKSTFQFIENLVKTIQDHWRRTYQISPDIMDQIRFWQNRRSAVFDTYSFFSPPSPLFADYAIIPASRNPRVAKGVATWAQKGYNWLINSEDPFRIKPTAGHIQVINPDLGIFRVAYPLPLDRTIKEIFPFALQSFPYNTGLLRDIDAEEEHTLDTIISVVWNTGPDRDYDSPQKFYEIEFFPTQALNLGPPIYLYENKEFARYQVKEVISEIGGGIGAGAYAYANNNFPVNAGILEALAQSHYAQIMNHYKDRVAGFTQLPGFVDAEIEGNISSIVYNITSSHGGFTSVDLRNPPEEPPLVQNMTQETLNYLRRAVAGSGHNPGRTGGATI